MLSDKQREDLNRAVVDYVATQTSSKQVLEQLRHALALPEPTVPAPPPSRDLERKWTALVRLQRRLITAEQQIETLKAELVSSSANQAVSKTDNWLPRAMSTQTLHGHRGRVTAVAFHPRWSMVASASEDGTVRVWDAESGDSERTIRAHPRAVHSLAFGSASGTLVTGSADMSVRIWDPEHEFSNTKTLLGHEHTVSAVVIIGDGTNDTQVASASRDNTVRLWQLETGHCTRVLNIHNDWVRCLSVSLDGTSLLSAGSDRVPMLTGLGTGSSTTEFAGGHEHVIECCAIATPEATATLVKYLGEGAKPETFFATGGRDNVIALWHSTNSLEPLALLKGHDNWVQGLAFHPSGRFLVSVGDDSTLRIWDLSPPGRLVKTIEHAHESFVTCIAWKSRKIATGSVDQTVKLWS